MGTTLQHGIFLPAEGERNCYAGLASNWTILDGMIGGYSSHAANLTIHVTAADKEAWNGKADASALTAHTGDTTIHVTAADKEAWNGKADALSQTQLDAVNSGIDSSKVQQIATNTSDISSLQSGKADDNSVVHTSGNETVGGSKRFGAVQSFTGYPSIRLYSQTDDVNVLPSSAEQRDIRFTDKNNKIIAYFIFQHRTDASEPFRTCWRQVRLDGTDNYYSVNFNILGEFYPENNNGIKLGTSTKRWKDCQTYLINGLTPSSLGMPSDTYVDISGYITDFSGGSNQYRAPNNGFVAIDISNTNSFVLFNNDLGFGDRLTGTNFRRAAIIQVRKNDTVIIQSSGGTLNYAKFYPFQGNI